MPRSRQTPADASPQRAVQSVEVGGRLLLALADAGEPLALKDLAARAELSPARAHPYLVSYARLGLIVPAGSPGRYALGPAALRLGLACLAQFDPLQSALPWAERLAGETGQALAVSVWGNAGPVVVRMIEARHALHVAMRVGTVMSLADTATGRAFAGALAEEALTPVLHGLSGHDERQLDALRRRLATARRELAQHGLCRAVGRPIPGVNAFAAPVRSFDNQPVLVLTLLGHQDHVPADWHCDLAQRLLATAQELSASFGASVS